MLPETKIMIMIYLLIVAAITVTSAEVTELEVHPEVIVQGGQISISGMASPEESVWLKSSFGISLPVSYGSYYREFNGIHFPKGDKVFTTTTENIGNIRLSLNPVPFFGTVEYPSEGPKNATNGTATLSMSFPQKWFGCTIDINGEKNVWVYGKAAEKATSVNMRVAMAIKTTASSSGHFYAYTNTSGTPTGAIKIAVGDKERTVYIVSSEYPVFDTGSGSYPSVPGTHYGKIIPHQPIFVHKLYTYPCAGTGGHSKRMTISNASGWCRTATWNGYKEDGHNTSFEDGFVLQPGVYNYTLETDSYPQIIHKPSVNTTTGTFTCEKFVDINGKVYKDWLPAIILS